ncbi:12483_t:CDS:2, partial [Ambispora gerdemannii]
PSSEPLKTLREKNKTPESYKPSLVNRRNLAYNILKNLEDDIIRDKEIPELYQSVDIYITGYALRKASNDHAEYMPIPDYGKNIDIIEPFSTNQESPSSQLGEISALYNRMSESFILSSPILRM